MINPSTTVAEGRAGPPDPPHPVLPERCKLAHGIPPWVSDGAVFFVTVNCLTRGENQLCTPEVARSLRENVDFRHRRGDWWTHLLVLMPDHLHMLTSFPRDKDMRQVIAKWKEFTAKSLSLHWQRDFFDHRLRGNESFEEKAHYVRMNPVRKGLCQEVRDWPYTWDDFSKHDCGGSGGPALP
jgi:REP element-mobilizing transposase RayT